MTFWWFWNQPPVVEEATVEDLDRLSEIHDMSFRQTWHTEELAALRAQAGVTILIARRASPYGTRKALGFVILRTAADEAEILTIAVDPAARGRGIARQLMRAALSRLYADRVKSIFLEVDAANEGAIALYKSLGMRQVGTRRGYYSASEGDGSALVMRLDLA
ncbi:ribosomal protein S18-alanine N-acetyltransferase [Stappia sp. GBMRC 2046]|uniref:Ribosomal protein S18-alanine N-acetyltransferase n=1 Tax=Stappia sediminis TaxID=2692190 RepID=A0A7X3LX81_9HYPH|nr:ribosomal protein S18-alanine N-acetyltransferase [Stappia sediminis]MXN66806.1 ribosomal protein S18-alanine N-acetyltransferase [Stappia sediminis]